MLYNLSQLLREPVGASRAFRVDEPFALPFTGAPVTQLSGDVSFVRTLSGLLARGELAGAVPEFCSRCLQPVVLPLRLVIEEEFFPTVDPVTGARLPDPPEPTPFRIDAHHHLDLTEAVRQAAILEEPMAPLCREDCRGLCPDCGADRNMAPCACAAGAIDSRWAGLAGLRTET